MVKTVLDSAQALQALLYDEIVQAVSGDPRLQVEQKGFSGKVQIVSSDLGVILLNIVWEGRYGLVVKYPTLPSLRVTGSWNCRDYDSLKNFWAPGAQAHRVLLEVTNKVLTHLQDADWTFGSTRWRGFGPDPVVKALYEDLSDTEGWSEGLETEVTLGERDLHLWLKDGDPDYRAPASAHVPLCAIPNSFANEDAKVNPKRRDKVCWELRESSYEDLDKLRQDREKIGAFISVVVKTLTSKGIAT